MNDRALLIRSGWWWCVLCWGVLALPAVPQEDVAEAGDVVAAVAEPQQMTRPERRRVFYENILVGVYLEHGDAESAWREPAAELLKQFCHAQAYDDYPMHPRPEGVPAASDLAEAREQLLAMGCDEPFLNYMLALMDPERDYRFRATDFEAQEAMLRSGEERGMPGLYVPVMIAMDCVINKGFLARYGANGDWVEKNRLSSCLNYITLFGDEVKLTPGDHAAYAELFKWCVDDFDQNLLLNLMTECEEVPADKQWLAHVVRGMVFIETAWASRGSGFAKTVEDDQWRKFAVYLQFAQDEFEAAWALRPDQAWAASQMIAVSMGQNNDREQVWFDRAVAADPLDATAYDYLLWASRTRWGGDDRKMLVIAQHAAAQGRYDTDVPDRIEYCIDRIIDDYGYDWLRPQRFGGEGAEGWRLLTQYLEARAAQPSPERDADWCWSRGIGRAHRGGRTADMWAFLEKMDNDPSRMVRPHVFRLDQRWAFGEMATDREPAVAAACRQIDAFMRRGDFAAAQQILDTIWLQAEHKLTRLHLRDRRRMIAWQRAYESGEWIDLFAHGLEGWRPTRGVFEQVDDEMHGVYANSHGGMRMTAGLQTGQRYEAEMKITLPQGFDMYGWGGAGFVLDPVLNRSSSRSIMVCLSRWNQRAIWVQDPDNEEDDDQSFGKFPDEPEITMNLQRWGQRVRVTLNGQIMVDGYELNTDKPQDFGLAIGSWHQGNDFKYKFHNLRVRQLFRSPFENAEEPDGRPQIF